MINKITRHGPGLEEAHDVDTEAIPLDNRKVFSTQNLGEQITNLLWSDAQLEVKVQEAMKVLQPSWADKVRNRPRAWLCRCQLGIWNVRYRSE